MSIDAQYFSLTRSHCPCYCECLTTRAPRTLAFYPWTQWSIHCHFQHSSWHWLSRSSSSSWSSLVLLWQTLGLSFAVRDQCCAAQRSIFQCLPLRMSSSNTESCRTDTGSPETRRGRNAKDSSVCSWSLLHMPSLHLSRSSLIQASKRDW